MKIRSLKHKLSIPFALVYGLVAVCGIFWSHQRKLDFIRTELISASRQYLEWSLALASIEQDPGQRQRFITSIAASAEVDWLILYDLDSGEILAGSRYEWNRKKTADLDDTTQSLIALGDTRMNEPTWEDNRLIYFGESRIFIAEDQRSLFHTIRAVGSFNLDEGFNDLLKTSMLMGIVWLGGGIFLYFCTYCLLRRTVIDRVENLKLLMDSHAKGDPLPVQIGLAEDELGQLGESFRRMLGEIQSSNRLLQRLALVASETDNGVIITDVNEYIEWVNAGFTRFTGYTLEEVKGKKPGAFLQGPKSSAETVRFIRKKVRAKESFSAELINYAKDGSEYYVTIDAKPLFENDVFLGFIAIQRDDTERFEHEQQLHVEREKANQANHAKSAFLSAMSHEIRTPMNGVIGVARLLEETKLDAQQKELVGIIHRSGESLMTVINDILDFSRIEAGELKISNEIFNLLDALESPLSLLISSCEKKGILLFAKHAETLPYRVRGDANRIRQILYNLIGNAIKFTEAGSITVSISCQPLEGATCLLKGSVRDTGIGIAEAHLSGLFERFYQVEDEKSHYRKGTGLGLAIVKRLASLMGGSVSVESVPGEGSVFHFSVCLEVVDWEGPERAKSAFSDVPAYLQIEPEALQEEITFRLERLGFSLVSDPHLARLCVSSDSSFSECREDAVILRLVPFLSAPLVNGAKPILRAPYLHSDLLTSLRSLLSEQSLADWMHSPRQHHLKTAPFHNLNIRLLVVEDSLINQKVIGAMLRSIRLKFDLVNDGAEAVDLFTKSTYDLILMDVHMPKMDGYEATRRIRALPNGSDCVIIALSAGVLQEQEEKALALGMDAFLSKPVTVEDIRAVVARFFSSGATANLAPGKDFII